MESSFQIRYVSEIGSTATKNRSTQEFIASADYDDKSSNLMGVAANAARFDVDQIPVKFILLPCRRSGFP